MKKEKKYRIKVSVLLRYEGIYWVAQGIEYDIAAQGRTIQEAKKAFEKTIIGQIILDVKDGLEPLTGVEKAPPITLLGCLCCSKNMKS